MLCAMMESYADVLLPQLDSVIQFMLVCTQDPRTEVAMEACEFWLVMADSAHSDRLSSYLPVYVASAAVDA